MVQRRGVKTTHPLHAMCRDEADMAIAALRRVLDTRAFGLRSGCSSPPKWRSPTRRHASGVTSRAGRVPDCSVTKCPMRKGQSALVVACDPDG